MVIGMKAKKTHKMLLIGIISVIILGGGASAFSFFIKSGNEEGNKKEAAKVEEQVVMLPLEPFIVNLNGTEESRFLKASLNIELSKTEAAERAKTRTPQIRDAVIMLITSKTAESLISPEGKMQFKDEVSISVNQILGENIVKNIYFTDFVMQ